jgi:hypothetical protein
MSDPSPQLDYAPAPPKRRKWIWRSIALILGLSVGLVSVKWGPQFVRTAKILYWQNKCLSYSAPADRVVYEEDPDAAAKLLATGSGEYVPTALNRETGKAPTTAASHVPASWSALRPRVTTFPLMMYARNSSPATAGVVFLHELTSPGGSRRLVCVRYLPQSPTFSPAFVAGYDYDSDVLIPATWTRPAARVARGSAFSVLSNIPRHPPRVRMYAGQPDPADPTHFTIRYEMWGQSDVLDGYLDNNDGVTLKPRTLPEDR